MGNGSLPHETRQQMLQKYSVFSKDESEGTSILRDKQTEAEYLLREMVVTNQDTLDSKTAFLRKRQVAFSSCSHLCQVERVLPDSHSELCRGYFKVYLLMELPSRSLGHELAARVNSNCRFEEKDLWGLIAACIAALSHLQRASISHQQLCSDAVLLTPQGNVKLYDPFLTAHPTNYEQAFEQKHTNTLYLAPELVEGLAQK